MPEGGERVVYRFWEEVFNAGKLNIIEELLTPDFVLHDLAAKKDIGLDELKDLLLNVRADLPEARAAIEEILTAEGDRIVTRLTFRAPAPATGAASLLPAQAQGYEFTLTGHSSAAAEFTLRIGPSGDTTDTSVDEGATAGGMLEYSAISISVLFGGKIRQAWLLWESIKARMELHPHDSDWHWPPWGWH